MIHGQLSRLNSVFFHLLAHLIALLWSDKPAETETEGQAQEAGGDEPKKLKGISCSDSW